VRETDGLRNSREGGLYQIALSIPVTQFPQGMSHRNHRWKTEGLLPVPWEEAEQGFDKELFEDKDAEKWGGYSRTNYKTPGGYSAAGRPVCRIRRCGSKK